jgi:hypothetical protein
MGGVQPLYLLKATCLDCSVSLGNVINQLGGYVDPRRDYGFTLGRVNDFVNV